MFGHEYIGRSSPGWSSYAGKADFSKTSRVVRKGMFISLPFCPHSPSLLIPLWQAASVEDHVVTQFFLMPALVRWLFNFVYPQLQPYTPNPSVTFPTPCLVQGVERAGQATPCELPPAVVGVSFCGIFPE